MKPLHPQIDAYKIGCGKVDRRTMTTLPQPLLLLRMCPKKGDISTLQKIGHFYFVLTVKSFYSLENQSALVRQYLLIPPQIILGDPFTT